MSSNSKSITLVSVQLFILLYLFLTGPVVTNNIFLLLLESFGVFLGLWAIQVMRTISVLNLRPEVKKGSTLVTSGPYAFIRHPMYASVLLVAFSLILNYPALPRIIAGIILLIDLIIKINFEEKFLEEHFGEKYISYKKKTYKLIPNIY